MIAAMILTGCRRSPETEGSRKKEAGMRQPAVSENAERPTSTPTPSPTPTPTPEPVVEDHTNNVDGHHEFQPHVISSVYLEEFGEDIKDTLFAYIDAVRNGEDSFDCPDQETYDWVTGRLAGFFCPIADVCVDTSRTAGPIFEDGKGYIYYLIPKDEVVQKQKDFEKEIVTILDDYVSDDYSDFEKIVSLYDYMCTTYTYDYYKLEHLQEMPQTICGVLQDKTGVCGEISALYNYLLLQVGVDCDQITGPTYSGDTYIVHHAWSYVNLDGTFYHVDPTYGLGAKAKLEDFLMTDECREERDGLPAKEYARGAYGDEARLKMEFECTDDTYEELWGIEHGGGACYTGLDRVNREVVCEDYSGYEFRVPYGK